MPEDIVETEVSVGEEAPLVEATKKVVRRKKRKTLTTKNAVPRAKRSASTRETQTRRKPWAPPSMLDTPPPPPGMRYRWIRAEMMGQQDRVNIGKRFREGFEPVHPDEIDNSYNLPTIDDGKHAGVIGVGGLILAKIPEETADERNAYFANLADQQMQGVDAELKKQSHPSMPMGAPERKSHISFGNPENKPGAS